RARHAFPTRRSSDLARYADEAVPFLVEGMARLGARRRGLVAVMAGGARMFELGHLVDVGTRNAHAVRRALDRAGISLVAEDVGGDRKSTRLNSSHVK